MKLTPGKLYVFNDALKKKLTQCIFCNSQKQLLRYKNQTLCPDCMFHIQQLFRENDTLNRKGS